MGYKAREDIVLRNIYDKYFVIDLWNQNYRLHENIVSINYVSYCIFSYIQKVDCAEIDDLIEYVYSEFSIPNSISREMINDDINKFLELFINLGYIISDNNVIVKNTNLKNVEKNLDIHKSAFDWEEWSIEVGKKGIPLAGGIELTSHCNMNCLHCYQQNLDRDSYMSTNDIKRIIDQLEDANVLFLYFTGGEIFTRKDFLEIYMYAKRKGFILSLLSNATIVPEKAFEIFKKYPPEIFSVSIYGMTEEIYNKVTQTKTNYNNVIRNCERIKKMGIYLELKFIILKENLHQFQQFIELCENLCVDVNYSSELFPTIDGDKKVFDYRISNEQIVDLIKIEKEFPQVLNHVTSLKNPYLGKEDVPLFMCDICETDFLIDDRGYLNPCSRYRINDYYLGEWSFKNAWADIQKIRKIKAIDTYKCRRCKYLQICSPCAAQNLLETGDINVPGKLRCDLAERKFKEFSKDIYSAEKNIGGEKNERKN